MKGIGSHLVRAAALLGLAALVVAGCGRRSEPNLVTFRASEGPDEFNIVPSKPLATPESYAQLPAPTPGGRNRTDPTPDADAIAALGGRPTVLTRRSGDGALIRYAGRYGVSPSIRAQLAKEDLEFRRQNDGRLLERWFNVNVYYKSYRDQALDQYRELERFRAAGFPSPAVPPRSTQ